MNQLKSPKMETVSSNILCDRLKAIDFLKASGQFHSIPKLVHELDIPSRRLRYILDNYCEGFVVKQDRRYAYHRVEKPMPKPLPLEAIAIKPKVSRQSEKKLEELRLDAYEQFRQQPNMTEERAWLKAYQQHPDIF